MRGRIRRPTEATAAALAVVLLLAGCAADDGRPRLPPTTGSFDYQLGADPVPAERFDVVVRDATAPVEEDGYSICYINAFQTQPGDDALVQGGAGAALLRDATGAPVVDPDWPDEHVLDPGTAEQRTAIRGVVDPLIEGCAARGADAVEFDNLDTPLRFDDPATGHVDPAGATELARGLVDLAHDLGLAAAQKNAPELSTRLAADVGFDFAIAEECAVFDECDAYRKVYGEHVLQIEYTDTDIDPVAVCATPDRAPLTIIRDRDLVAPGDDGYVRRQCP